jgi:hypothetical protein
MKKLIITCIFIIVSLFCIAQDKVKNNTVYLTYQPTDCGYGLRYDRKIKNFGVYTSISKGTYKVDDGIKINYRKKHYKATLGCLFYVNKTSNYLSLGLDYNKYGRIDKYGIIFEKEISSILSFELGGGVRIFKLFNIGIRADLLTGESAIDVGISF